ncbi:helix-turn-helix domain-containing protein [Micromonospora sp. NPDC048999]|uniref:helix-turn-helix domain-containing protein n=1 Tax=Micromonospora sp. NPDC048999 TaxID=3155391 RepID=UPI00340A855E
MHLWRGRYTEQGLPGLTDRRQSGPPPRFTPAQVAEVKALACQLPAETHTTVDLERPRPGRRSRQPGHHGSDLRIHDPPDPGRRHAQTLAAPVLDLHP